MRCRILIRGPLGCGSSLACLQLLTLTIGTRHCRPGFMSTTVDRGVAAAYASAPGKPGLVFELSQGMVDRGADISFLSYYPHEREVLFAPLCGLEVRGSRVTGTTAVLDEVRV